MASFRKDPLYNRWRSALCRYHYNVHDRSVNIERTEKLTMAKEWLPPDNLGFVAFRAWVQEQAAANGITDTKFKIERRNDTKGFTPENCYLVPVKESKALRQQRRTLQSANAAFDAELTRLEVLYGLRQAA